MNDCSLARVVQWFLKHFTAKIPIHTWQYGKPHWQVTIVHWAGATIGSMSNPANHESNLPNLLIPLAATRKEYAV